MNDKVYRLKRNNLVQCTPSNTNYSFTRIHLILQCSGCMFKAGNINITNIIITTMQ